MSKGKKERHPWDQLRGEDDVAYVRFLIYRNLGPARSIDAAYALAKESKRGKSQRVGKRASGQWPKNSMDFSWPTRASAWDVWMLTEIGRDVVVFYLNALRKAACKVFVALDNPKIRPKGWGMVMESINVLGSFVPAETIAALRDNPGGVGAADSPGEGADSGGAADGAAPIAAHVDAALPDDAVSGPAAGPAAPRVPAGPVPVQRAKARRKEGRADGRK